MNTITQINEQFEKFYGNVHSLINFLRINYQPKNNLKQFYL